MQIALLFLANLSVTNELIWAAFFKAAGHHPSLPAYILPPSNFVKPLHPHPKIDRLPECLYPGMMQQLTGAANVSAEKASHACSQLPRHIAFASKMSQKCKNAPSVIDDQQLFNVYMHSASPELVDCNSIFAKYQVSNRVYTKHGYCQFATMAGSLALLKTALSNPENTHFMQLSDTSIPLYHPALVYVHVLSLPKPFVNACPHENTLKDAARHPSLFTGFQFLPRHWRKSMAWFVLQRDWAQFVLDDQHVVEVFKRSCVSPKEYCYCIADEHYIPSLFASYEMDNMTQCRDDIHYQDWARIKASHPHSFKVEEVNSTLLPVMRGHNGVSNYEKSMASALRILNMTIHVEPLDKLYHSMPRECHLFARKFPANTQQAVYAMLSHGDNAEPFHE
jgi:hypothetical protein